MRERRLSSGSWLPHIHAETCRTDERDQHGLALLAEIRMAKHDVVGTGGDGEIADRCFADLRAVQPDLRPGQRVDRDRALRRIDGHGGHLARQDLNGPRSAITDELVDKLEIVPARWNHDAVDLAAAKEAP